MLGAWQLGDVEKLRADYGDDVVVVNGSWAPPIFGWTNYLAITSSSARACSRVRMDRFNTFHQSERHGGWACYQWEFAAVVDGQQTESQARHGGVREAQQSLGHRAQSHFARPEGPASRSCQRTFWATATGKAAIT